MALELNYARVLAHGRVVHPNFGTGEAIEIVLGEQIATDGTEVLVIVFTTALGSSRAECVSGIIEIHDYEQRLVDGSISTRTYYCVKIGDFTEIPAARDAGGK